MVPLGQDKDYIPGALGQVQAEIMERLAKHCTALER